MAALGLSSLAPARAEGLPAGARQRLCLAAALVHRPALLLLDEPTADIDPPTRRDLWRAIEAAAAEGATVILASAIMAEGESCDRLLLLDRGRSLGIGRPDELKAAFAGASIEDVFEAMSAGRRLGDAA
jgi:ABC-type multidrug transport system ATPase subunit